MDELPKAISMHHHNRHTGYLPAGVNLNISQVIEDH